MADFQVPTKPTCPVCHKTLDGATGLNTAARSLPQDAISICAYCATILIYRGTKFIEATPEERASWPIEVQALLLGARRTVQRIIEERKKERIH